MGHLQDMDDKQRIEFQSFQYERNKEARRGNCYAYWTQKLDDELLGRGYKMYQFDSSIDRDATSVQSTATSVVWSLREQGNYARIICGYSQNQQRIRMFSIYYKPRK